MVPVAQFSAADVVFSPERLSMATLVKDGPLPFSIFAVEAHNVDPGMYGILLGLTLFPTGEMWNAFIACATKPRVWAGTVFVATIDGEVVGWALRWKLTSSRAWSVFLYVHPVRRRRTVGTRLVKAAQHGVRHRVKGHPWDEASTRFWSSISNM